MIVDDLDGSVVVQSTDSPFAPTGTVLTTETYDGLRNKSKVFECHSHPPEDVADFITADEVLHLSDLVLGHLDEWTVGSDR